jgi:hypothetical protein
MISSNSRLREAKKNSASALSQQGRRGPPRLGCPTPLPGWRIADSSSDIQGRRGRSPDEWGDVPDGGLRSITDQLSATAIGRCLALNWREAISMTVASDSQPSAGRDTRDSPHQRASPAVVPGLEPDNEFGPQPRRERTTRGKAPHPRAPHDGHPAGAEPLIRFHQSESSLDPSPKRLNG